MEGIVEILHRKDYRDALLDNSDRVKELRMSVFGSHTTKIPCPRYETIQECMPLGKPLVHAKDIDEILLDILDAMYGTCGIIL